MVKRGLPRRLAEGRMRNGGSSPDAFTSSLRVQGAGCPNEQKSLGPASTYGTLAMFDVARKTSRLFGPIDTSAEKDVSLAEKGGPGGEVNSDSAAQAPRPRS